MPRHGAGVGVGVMRISGTIPCHHTMPGRTWTLQLYPPLADGKASLDPLGECSSVQRFGGSVQFSSAFLSRLRMMLVGISLDISSSVFGLDFIGYYFLSSIILHSTSWQTQDFKLFHVFKVQFG